MTSLQSPPQSPPPCPPTIIPNNSSKPTLNEITEQIINGTNDTLTKNQSAQKSVDINNNEEQKNMEQPEKSPSSPLTLSSKCLSGDIMEKEKGKQHEPTTNDKKNESCSTDEQLEDAQIPKSFTIQI